MTSGRVVIDLHDLLAGLDVGFLGCRIPARFGKCFPGGWVECSGVWSMVGVVTVVAA